MGAGTDDPVGLAPVPEDARTQSPADLFVVFAGANIAATTLQTGAALAPDFGTGAGIALIVAGSLFGSAIVAALAPMGSRLGVPSVIAARAALGVKGAALVAAILYLTNFAWIAVNNVIAASACAQIAGGEAMQPLWAVLLGLVATAAVAAGPRVVARADRIAVPVMLLIGGVLLVRLIGVDAVPAAAVPRHGSWARGLDVIVGYQVSWILMFGDYPRFTRSPRSSGIAVFLGLALTSLWFMPLGLVGARVAGSPDLGVMLAQLGFGASGALMLTLATITTNFVNIYMSALAWKSMFPRASPLRSIWVIGGVGTALSVISTQLLQRYEQFMLVLGALLVPVGGILIARFLLVRRAPEVAALYDSAGAHAGISLAALVAWIAGSAIYFGAGSLGGTLPALVTSIVLYLVIERRDRRLLT